MKNNKLIFLAIAIAMITTAVLVGGVVKAFDDNNQNDSQLRKAELPPYGEDSSAPREMMNFSPMMNVDEQFKQKIKDENGDFSSSIRSSQMGVNIGPSGRAQLMNATANSVNGSTMVASVFGINFTIDISNAKIMGGVVLPPLPALNASTTTTTPSVQSATISVGDKLMIMGAVDATSGIIKAEAVKDLTTQTQSQDTIRQRIQQLLELINQLKSQLHF